MRAANERDGGGGRVNSIKSKERVEDGKERLVEIVRHEAL